MFYLLFGAIQLREKWLKEMVNKSRFVINCLKLINAELWTFGLQLVPIELEVT